MQTAQTAAEAYDRYMAALGADLLIQKRWHAEVDGRHLACGLGVIGGDVDDPEKCPAQIMPRWLAKMVPWFFDSQAIDDAKDWGRRFYAELKRIDGHVPFSVVHDWHATVVAPLAIEVAMKRKSDVSAHEAVRDLHARALAGDLAPRDEWRAKLRPAYADAFANAFANAYADANADAFAFADAFADANADAFAYADANAFADANAASIKRLADGMVDCLARVETVVR